jgi:hypothetical protein
MIPRPVPAEAEAVVPVIVIPPKRVVEAYVIPSIIRPVVVPRVVIIVVVN